MTKKFTATILLLLFAITYHLQAQVIDISNDNSLQLIGEQTQVLQDSLGTLSFEQAITASGFTAGKARVPNLGVSPSVYWIRFTVKNNTSSENLVFEIGNPIIDLAEFYDTSNQSVEPLVYNNKAAFAARPTDNINYIFPLGLKPGETKTYFLRIKSNTQLLLPMYIGNDIAVAGNSQNRTLINGIYFGIMLVMFLYNLFVFLIVKEKSYFYYILYIFSVAAVQVGLTGVGFKYIWPASPMFEQISIYLFSAFTAFASLGFIKKFLKTETLAPRLDKVSWLFVVVYLGIIAAAFVGQRIIAYNLLNVCGLFLSLYMLSEAIYIRVRFKSRPALFFLIAWSTFLVSVIFFVAKDSGALPYNNFTSSILQIGSALEAILLSFALADKINVLTREKEESQAESLRIAQENETIIREQNVVLETRVEERTLELKKSNQDLNIAIEELKQAQAQLVDQEKMASLGQLTAGIAHEINNPINFVIANVKPMKRDVDILIEMISTLEAIASSDMPADQKAAKINEMKEECDYDYLKSELEFLLKGISEGSSRTAEIVKGLRIFSRVDEDDLKVADVNEGLDSTIIICNNLLGSKIRVAKEYDADTTIECYPGKLNQVFMNMISNGIYAVKERFKDNSGGVITIGTKKNEDTLLVSIKDNGSGMDEITLHKLFEPFFTTKPVGEGTGLGLSIAYNTIKKHNGTIKVKSTLGEGTEFIMILPVKQ